MMDFSFTDESDAEDEIDEHSISKTLSKLDKAVAKAQRKLKEEQLGLEASGDNEEKEKGKKRKYEFSTSEAAQKKNKIKSSPEKKTHKVISDSVSESSEDDEDQTEKAMKRRKKMKKEEKKRKYEFSTSQTDQKKKIISSQEETKHKVTRSDSESDCDEDDDKKADKRRMTLNFALDFPKVYANNSHNKRIMCPFCLIPQCNFVPHLLGKHRDEPEVQNIIALPPKNEKRQDLIGLLRLRGNHAHNIIVEKEKQGMFLPEGRTVGPWRLRDFSPCPDCLKWIPTHTLLRHLRVCLFRKLNPDLSSFPVNNLVFASKLMAGHFSKAASEEMKKEVFPIMRNDKIGGIAKRDEMIVMMGNATLKRNIGNIAMRRYTTSSVMRLLARLLSELRSLQPEESLQNSLTFYAALHPSQYDNFVTAVFRVCKEEAMNEAQEEQEELERCERVGAVEASINMKAPSNAIKLSYDIQKLCCMKVALAIDDSIKQRGENDRKTTKRFMDKYAAKWEIDVKRKARAVLRDRKLGASPKMPDPQDIVVFSTFLVETLRSMKKPTTYSELRQMQYFLEARVITYNRRRPGEVQNMQ